MTSFAQAGQVTQLIRLDVVIILSLFVPKHPKRDDMMNLSSVSLFVFGSARHAAITIALQREQPLRMPIRATIEPVPTRPKGMIRAAHMFGCAGD